MKEWLELIKGIKPIKEKHFVEKPAKKIKISPKEVDYSSFYSPANGVDGSTQKKFSKEKFDIQASLDLHGYTHDTAFDAVISFIKKSHAAHKRCVVIITGKGDVLRGALPKWLENPEVKNLILQTRQPSNSLGGSGALMILLRRIRNK